MKSQVNASPQRSRFASRSWRRFSPTSSTPASASAPISSERDVLGRGEDLDLRARVLANPLEVGADARRVEALELSHGHQSASATRLRARRAPPGGRCARRRGGGSRAAPGCSSCRARPRRQPPPRPGPAAARATATRSSIRPCAAPSMPVERRRAPRRRPRSSRGRSRARSPRRSRRPSSRPSRRCRRRARASRSAPSPRPPGPASATGRQSATITSGDEPGLVGRVRVGLVGAGDDVGVDAGAPAASSWQTQRGAVHLAAHHDVRRARCRARRRAAAVVAHAPRLVTGLDRDVEGVVGRLADPAHPGREGRPGAGQLGLQPAHSVSLAPFHRAQARSDARLRAPDRPRGRPAAPPRGPRAVPSSFAASAAFSAAADRGALRDAGLDQVVARDLEVHMAQA